MYNSTDSYTLVSTKPLNNTSAYSFAIPFDVSTSNENTTNPKEVNDLQAKIDILQAEKRKLEAELKSREEMMSNLLSFIQASK
ncbi:MAG: hypothetical protein ACKO7B_16065 [Flavobacteriales bacterium]